VQFSTSGPDDATDLWATAPDLTDSENIASPPEEEEEEEGAESMTSDAVFEEGE